MKKKIQHKRKKHIEKKYKVCQSKFEYLPWLSAAEVIFVKLLQPRGLSLSPEVLDKENEEGGGEEEQHEYDVQHRQGILCLLLPEHIITPL